MSDSRSAPPQAGASQAIAEARAAATLVETKLRNVASLTNRHQENLVLKKHGSYRVMYLLSAKNSARSMGESYAALAQDYERAFKNMDAEAWRTRQLSMAHGVVAGGKAAEIVLACCTLGGNMKVLTGWKKAASDGLKSAKEVMDAQKDIGEAVHEMNKPKGSAAAAGTKVVAGASKLLSVPKEFFEIGKELADVSDAAIGFFDYKAPKQMSLKKEVPELMATIFKCMAALVKLARSAEMIKWVKANAGTLEEFNKSKVGSGLEAGGAVVSIVVNTLELIIAIFAAIEEYQRASLVEKSALDQLGFSSRMSGGALSQKETEYLAGFVLTLGSNRNVERQENYKKLIRNHGTARQVAGVMDREMKRIITRMESLDREVKGYQANLVKAVSDLTLAVGVLKNELRELQEAWQVADANGRADIERHIKPLHATLERGYLAIN